jgi:hypothetical protein
MKGYKVILISLFSVCTLSGQMHEIGIVVGGSNTIAEVGNTRFINPNSQVIGIIYKWNKTTRYSYRASILSTNLSSSDAQSGNPARIRRSYSFQNQLLELSAGIEVNFFDYNLLKDDSAITPYFYSGLNLLIHKPPLSVITPSTTVEELGVSIPLIIGIKTRISPSIALGVETGIRYSFTDNIDGVNDINTSPFVKIDNVYNNDWYVFTSLTLSYTFGQLPCYCN